MVEERQHTAYADLAGVYLDDDELARVLAETMECVLNWTTADGWPVGMVHGFVADDRPHLWMTCAAARKRVAAIERDARVSVVVNAPSPVMGAGRSAVFKGRCTIHRPGDDGFADVAAWFYPALAAKAYPASERVQAGFVEFLDSPDRVVLEVAPTWQLTYDGRKLTGG